MACPPVTAEFVSSLQANASAAVPKPPQLTAYRFFRSSLGQLRVDTSSLSILQDPVSARTIILEHGPKLAHIGPYTPNVCMPGMPQMPGMPAMPQMPGAPPLPGMNVQALGTSMLQGHEVQGFRYVIQPPQPPQPPQLPGMPGMPKVPGAPQMPGAPQVPGMPAIPGAPQPPQIPGAPQLPNMPSMPHLPSAPQIPGAPPAPQMPQVPTTVESWSAQTICLPMATKIDGGFGSQTSICQSVSVGEPNPAFFQIPSDYKQYLAAKPKAV